MDRGNLLKHLIFLMFFIFLAHLLAEQFYWYYSIAWFDMFMHFLGGVWLGLFFFYVFSRNKQIVPSFFKIIFFVLMVGILWEVFQFFTKNYIGRDPFDIIDTLSDVFFDLLGGLCVILYVWKKRLKSHFAGERVQ
ncbi:MAG: hypothetical protein WD963_01585 [Candidatus Paceibacterota bacterium]